MPGTSQHLGAYAAIRAEVQKVIMRTRDMKKTLSLCMFLFGAGTLHGQETIENQASDVTSAAPNDPFFKLQPGFPKMQVLQAWEISRGSQKCLIGFIEFGIDLEHEDFPEGRIEEYQLPGMDHPDTWRNHVHGTSLVGMVAAKVNNGKGVAGLVPECKVLVASYGRHESFKNNPRVWNNLIIKKDAEAIHYLVDRGCRVINCSFTTIELPVLEEAFAYAIKHDVVMVIGSGNFNRSFPNFPAGKIDVLCVGGIDRNDRRWLNDPVVLRDGREFIQGSNYGKGLNVVAPIDQLVLCDAQQEEALPIDKWQDFNKKKLRKGYQWEKGTAGTSCAAPYGTALAALIRSLRPDLNHKDVIKIIERGATNLGDPGWDEETGYGRMNFYRSLLLARDWPKNTQTNNAVSQGPGSPQPE